MFKTLIIAEAGVNHNGDVNIAKKLIDSAKAVGADMVKFQTAIPQCAISKYARKAEYQINNNISDESQLEMCKKLHFSFEIYYTLFNYCKKNNIMFLSTPFDIESIRFLNTLDMPFWKIPSGEITNYPYLVEIGKTKKNVVMSTGMATINEISEAINVLKDNGTENIKLLHCNTEYPTPYYDVNLKAMLTLKDRFGFDVGYSDHSNGIEVPIAAVAMGATIIEKHFTLDRNMKGPDHKASLEPKEFKQMVDAIRNIELAIGDGNKVPSQSESKNIVVARKSIIAKCDIFTIDNLTTKRPGNGISPMRWNDILGKIAIRDFDEDELIEI